MMNSPEHQESGDIKQETVLTEENDSSEIDSVQAYFDFFDDSVREFFSLTYLNEPAGKGRKSKKSDLQASKITLNTCHYCPTKNQARLVDLTKAANVVNSNSDGSHANSSKSIEIDQLNKSEKGALEKFSNLPGTLWTEEEKDVFFNCLARYTIHRVDEFGPHLPNKSLAEIYAYYTLLKIELQKLKQHEIIEDNSVDSYVAVEVASVGVRYSDLPIAYEIDEDLLEYEEEQSIALGNMEQILSSKRASKKAAQFNEYTEQKESENTSLLEKENLHNLAKIYRGNRHFPCLSGRKSCRLYYNSYVFLEELIKYRTREILGNILSKKAIVTSQLLDNSSYLANAQVKIYTQDIWKAAMDLKWFETSMGDRTRHRDGKYPFLEAYWQCLVRSLDISVKDHQQILDQSKVVFNSFKSCDQTPSQLDFFLHTPPAELTEDYDEDQTIEVGARGYEDDGYNSKESMLTELQTRIPDNSSFNDKEHSATLPKQDTVSDDWSSERILASPEVNETEAHPISTSNKPFGGIPERTIITKESSRSLWLEQKIRALKRSLQDCEGEDRLLQLEEINLELLDHKRDSTYLQELKKKLKIDADTTEHTEDNSIYREDMILENLNHIWDRSFAFY